MISGFRDKEITKRKNEVFLGNPDVPETERAALPLAEVCRRYERPKTRAARPGKKIFRFFSS